MRAASISLVLCAAALLGGCGDPPPPESTMPADGSNPRAGGSPQERIANIQSNPTLTPAEKAMRIKAVKERNHLP